jgi:hypothetical protein
MIRKLDNKILVFGIITILLMSIPQAITATTLDVDNEQNEDYQLNPSNTEKGEWKTNYFCRIRASGYGNLDFLVLGTTLWFWIGPCSKVGVYLWEGDCTVSGILGTDRADNIELNAFLFCGILFEDDGGWDQQIYMNGFAFKCKYKVE